MTKHKGKISNPDHHKEGSTTSKSRDGSSHETEWYGSDKASLRSSRNVQKDGSVTDEHTTKQR